MNILYNIISTIAYILGSIYGRGRARAGSEIWRGRLGLIEQTNPVDIWMHAASVGETKVATYLIDYLLSKNPNLRIYVSTMTEAGQKTARTITNGNVTTGFLPLDHPSPVNRTLDLLQPKMLVIAETEIWPNLIKAASQRNIDIILVNGRMSESAFGKYKLARKMFREILSLYHRLFLKTTSDKERYEFFGVGGEQVVVSGDMKFDAPLLPRSEGRIQEIRNRIGATEKDFVLVCGSTRPGEEQLLIKLLDNLKKRSIRIKLVIAPRHLERIEQLLSELSVADDSIGLYSKQIERKQIILVDKMGCLNDLYLAANLAFVGGTLVDIGGHNILEPVWAGTPVLFGASTVNVNEAKDYIIQNNYGKMVSDINEMTGVVSKFAKGELSFSIKTKADLAHSPSALAGDYILTRLSDV